MTDTPHPMAGKTCRCGQGKVSAYDGKCGNCRTRRERAIHSRLLDGWPREAAVRGYLHPDERIVMKYLKEDSSS